MTPAISHNAGGNERPLRDYCKESGVILELIAPDTPQIYGVAKKITVVIGRGNLQMFDSLLSEEG
jgi:hypothetical protein